MQVVLVARSAVYTELAFSVIVATVVANIHWVYSDLACVAG